jgi:acetyl-CoA carboxylase biotin carboxylase subunit
MDRFPFSKVLVANRGEIAIRVIRACHELGLEAVAVFSEADATALHVQLADEALHIGPAPSAESYLNIERIIEAARRSGAGAIHPGYGFLSERAAFADACAEAGIVFVGPSGDSMRAMGDKLSARERAKRHGVPTVPGSDGALADPAEARRVAEAIGLPVMLKASAGGGGKGMRLVREAAELESAFAMASGEAKSAFGDATVYIEKYIERPKHIEIQVLADSHGNTVWLGERECSVQRRHQKLIEETPSAVLDEDLRRRIGESAIAAARACGYVNAGTVEFMLDAAGNYYFLEMNTRLQVEHPITELVTGRDLVHEQLHVAAGLPLSFAQEEIRRRGAAIEVRVYAEDADNNYAPSPGVISHVVWPGGPGVRVDAGVYAGYAVPLHYDPLLAKISVWDEDRPRAIARMRRALRETRIGGVVTSVPFAARILDHADFTSGRYDTHFLDTRKGELSRRQDYDGAIAAALGAELVCVRENGAGAKPNMPLSRWKEAGRNAALSGLVR